MLGIIEHQTFISILEWYDCMVFTCRIAINLIRMIGQDDAFWQYGKVSQRKILLGKCLFVVTIPSSPIIASLAASSYEVFSIRNHRENFCQRATFICCFPDKVFRCNCISLIHQNKGEKRLSFGTIISTKYSFTYPFPNTPTWFIISSK